MDGPTTPLPTQDSDMSDNGLDQSELNHYVIRLTPHGKFTREQLQETLQGEYQITQYVVAKETVPQEHYHIVMSVDESLGEQAVRDIIKAFLVPFWQLDSGKLPKGFGNKQYNLQVAEDLDKAVSYCLKSVKQPEDYFFDGFHLSYIDARRLDSFEKKKPCNFKVEYQELCDIFHKTDMDLLEFGKRLHRLKSKYGQNVTFSSIYSQSLSALSRRNPEDVDELYEQYLYKQ